MDQKIFEGDLQPVLADHGYDGLHDLKGGKVSEGVATFWRKSRFRCLDHRRVVVADAIENDPLFADVKKWVDANEVLRNDVLKRTTAVQTVVLEVAESLSSSSSTVKRGLVVGNTHLYFRPDADHIRLIQIGVCMKLLEQALAQAQESRPDLKFSLLLFGDFNSTPPFGVLQFMRTGLVRTMTLIMWLFTDIGDLKPDDDVT